MRSPHVTNLLRALAALSLLGSAGCDLLKTPQNSISDPPNHVAAPVAPPSAASEELRIYYARLQTQFLAQGLLRTDGGQRDAPFTDRILAQNFVRIAAFDEYTNTQNGPVQSQTPSTIRRWETPVRLGLRFGASVPPDVQAADSARVAAYVAQLARATRHSIRMDNTNPNFIVQIVNEDERRALGPAISADLPGVTPAELAGITEMDRSTYCLVYAQNDPGNTSVYTRAFAVIRAEHPDLMRLACINEEIAQGLGLANDSPQARPSIFNDNQEFALLTPQDALMLRMLYDPSLTPGMTAEQARPIAAALATRLLGGNS